MEFVSQIRKIPLTRTTRQRLQRFAKELKMAEEAAAGYVIERFMEEQGELQLRLASARDTAEKDRHAGVQSHR